MLFNFVLAGIASSWQPGGPAEWIAAFVLALGTELLLALGLHWLAAPFLARLARPLVYGVGLSFVGAAIVSIAFAIF